MLVKNYVSRFAKTTYNLERREKFGWREQRLAITTGKSVRTLC